MARFPAGSPDRNAAENSTRPAMTAQTPTIRARTSAVGPGQASATAPAARSASPSSRCPRTGPALRLLNARAACSPTAMNAFFRSLRCSRHPGASAGQASA